MIINFLYKKTKKLVLTWVFPFSYETSDGTSRQEEGKLDNPQSENAALTVTGQYAYVAPDGKHYTVTFTAGPNGFQPKTSLGQK